jgi:hypothetical protein
MTRFANDVAYKKGRCQSRVYELVRPSFFCCLNLISTNIDIEIRVMAVINDIFDWCAHASGSSLGGPQLAHQQ